MDNFFDILIGLVIIYSFLSPLFKKKKGAQSSSLDQIKNKKPNEKFIRPNQQSVQTEPKQQVSSVFDMFQEFESLLDENKTRQSEHMVDILEHKQTETAMDVFNEHSPTLSEHTSRVNVKKEVKPLENLKNVKELNLLPIIEKQNLAILNIRSKLRNPHSIKEMILISEILGKPKAFRHR
jgi:hypothetical protein